jgi:cellulose synthase (UDP-forming)
MRAPIPCGSTFTRFRRSFRSVANTVEYNAPPFLQNSNNCLPEPHIYWYIGSLRVLSCSLQQPRYGVVGYNGWPAGEIVGKRPIRLNLAQGIGILALGYYISWWLSWHRSDSLILIFFFVLALLFSATQFLGSWWFYRLARQRVVAPRQEHSFTVDVYVTTCGEPIKLIETTLQAALAMEGQHRTYLLDDADDPACAQLCARLGAGYLARPGQANAKAGNLNSALPRTTGDIIVIFDVDHVAHSSFLTETVHHFVQPQIGFVQVMLTFTNRKQTWMAQAATETSYDWYNPTSCGMDVVGGASLMGSNALIRRTALESIGGYRAGLAEDLATSVALHAAGWRSVYVACPLAPGLAPASLVAWYDQQLKWARGVFEVMLTSFPRAFTRLSWGLRLAYLVRLTKYWVGPAVLLHLLLTAVVLFAQAPARALVQDYLLHLLPLALADLWIRREALRLYRHPSIPAIVPVRALALIYFTWPVYNLAWLMAVLRLPLSFRPTPKAPIGGLNPLWLLPQALTSGVLFVGLSQTVADPQSRPYPLVILFAALQIALQLALILSWLRWRRNYPRPKATVYVSSSGAAPPPDHL